VAYNFQANNLFYYVDPTDEAVKLIYATAEAHSSSLFGTLAVARSSPYLGKRSSFVGCSMSQQSDLNMAAEDGSSYAANATQ
jgi:peptidyl-Lys metalloendopeptidase